VQANQFPDTQLLHKEGCSYSIGYLDRYIHKTSSARREYTPPYGVQPFV